MKGYIKQNFYNCGKFIFFLIFHVSDGQKKLSSRDLYIQLSIKLFIATAKIMTYNLLLSLSFIDSSYCLSIKINVWRKLPENVK